MYGANRRHGEPGFRMFGLDSESVCEPCCRQEDRRAGSQIPNPEFLQIGS